MSGVLPPDDELEHPAIKVARQTCAGCPDQWEGELHDGRHFYFRYRWGIASLALGPTRRDVAGIARAEQGSNVAVSVMRSGDYLSGMFDSDAERGETFRRLFGLIPQSPEDANRALGPQ